MFPMRKTKLSRRRFLRLGTNATALGIASNAVLLTGLSSGMDRSQPKDQTARPYPGGVKADIWVFSGQSNSEGWALFKAPVEPDPRIMFFNADNRWVLAEEPF